MATTDESTPAPSANIADRIGPYYVEIIEHKNGEFSWHAKDTHNGKIVFNGEGHTTRADALRAWSTVESRLVMWTRLRLELTGTYKGLEVRDLTKPEVK